MYPVEGRVARTVPRSPDSLLHSPAIRTQLGLSQALTTERVERREAEKKTLLPARQEHRMQSQRKGLRANKAESKTKSQMQQHLNEPAG